MAGRKGAVKKKPKAGPFRPAFFVLILVICGKISRQRRVKAVPAIHVPGFTRESRSGSATMYREGAF
jgi:hypothetical protein